MKYCTNCNSTLKEGAKFCTKCGTPIQKMDIQHEIVEKEEKVNQPEPFHKQQKKVFPLNKILLGIAVIMVLVFVGKSFLPNDGQLSDLVGEWHDPSGVLLGDSEAIITIRKKGDIVVGEDRNKTIYIQLIQTGNKNYSGLVVLNGIDGDFEVHYYEEEDKLVFFSTLTKTSWNIKKLK